MSKTLYIMSAGALKRRLNTLLLEPKDEESRYLLVETAITEGAPYEPFKHAEA